MHSAKFVPFANSQMQSENYTHIFRDYIPQNSCHITFVTFLFTMPATTMAFAFISYSGYAFAKVTLESFGLSLHHYELVNITSSIDDSECEEMEVDEMAMELNINEEINQQRSKSVFQVIGEKAFGKYGVYLNYSTFIALCFACVTSLIMEYELLLRIVEYIFIKNNIIIPVYLDEHFIFIYILVFVSPIIFILNWKQLTFVSKIS
eukprot:317428_1